MLKCTNVKIVHLNMWKIFIYKLKNLFVLTTNNFFYLFLSFEDIWQVEFNNISFTSGKSLYIKSYGFKNAIYL